MENPQAFPMCNELGDVYSPGMTLRDYFAAKAMQALLVDFSAKPEYNILNIIDWAYVIADTMLKARKEARNG